MTDESTSFAAKKPNLDWSQVRKTVLLLNLVVTPIERAMNEGHASVAEGAFK